MKGRPFADRRLDPDPAAVHLDDLFGDGESEAGATLRVARKRGAKKKRAPRKPAAAPAKVLPFKRAAN
jgi:hypothetical protein